MRSHTRQEIQAQDKMFSDMLDMSASAGMAQNYERSMTWEKMVQIEEVWGLYHDVFAPGDRRGAYSNVTGYGGAEVVA